MSQLDGNPASAGPTTPVHPSVTSNGGSTAVSQSLQSIAGGATTTTPHQQSPPRPVLKGTVASKDGFVTFSGEWAMSEADTITSGFSYRRTGDVPASASKQLGALLTDGGVHHPFSGLYSGYFMIKLLKDGEAKVEEKDVLLVISSSTAGEDGLYRVVGQGKNPYGVYDLKGTFRQDNGSITVRRFFRPRRGGGTPKSPRVGKRKSTGSAERPKKVKRETTPTLNEDRHRRRRSVPAHLRDPEFAVDTPRPKSTGKSFDTACKRILDVLTRHQWSWPFMKPVDPAALGIPDYYDVIKHPMDLGTVSQRLQSGAYDSMEAFCDDVRLTFRNAMAYNNAKSDVHVMANSLLKLFESELAKRQRDIQRSYEGPAGGRGGGRGGKRGGRGGASRRGGHSASAAAMHAIDAAGLSSNSSEIFALQQQVATLTQAVQQLVSSQTSAQPMNVIVSTGGQGMQSEVADNPAVQHALNSIKLTWEEKQELSNNINLLGEAQLERVLQIIQERMPLGSTSQEEIEIDIDSLDIPTLRELQRYVRNCLHGGKKSGGSGKSMKGKKSSSRRSMEADTAYTPRQTTSRQRSKGGTMDTQQHGVGEEEPDDEDIAIEDDFDDEQYEAPPMPPAASTAGAVTATTTAGDGGNAAGAGGDADADAQEVGAGSSTRNGAHPETAITTEASLGGGAPPPPPPPAEATSRAAGGTTSTAEFEMSAWTAAASAMPAHTTGEAGTAAAAPASSSSSATAENSSSLWQSAREQAKADSELTSRAEAERQRHHDASLAEAEEQRKSSLQEAKAVEAAEEAEKQRREEDEARQRSMASGTDSIPHSVATAASSSLGDEAVLNDDEAEAALMNQEVDEEDDDDDIDGAHGWDDI